jgi:hypothetical protein
MQSRPFGRYFGRAAGAASALVVALGLAASTAAWSAAPKTVIELFTSQGCYSCPPADAFLGELTKRDDVIALTLPVDYWDYLGWKDTFGSPAHSKRQSDYARQRGDRKVYTPQMVFNGKRHAVGSRRGDVLRALKEENSVATTNWVDVTLKSDDNSIMVSAGDFAGQGTAPDATIWLLLSTKAETVAIERGENRGKTLTYHNVVRQMVPIGAWHGESIEVELPKSDLMEGYDGCTAILQVNGAGQILGAAHFSGTTAEHN